MQTTENGAPAAHIAAVGVAAPSFTLDQQLAGLLVEKHYKDELRPRSMEVAQKVFAHPSIRTRRISVDSIAELEGLKGEDQDKRMDRFTRWAVELSSNAVMQALERAELHPRDVDTLIINTCTGYLCPGIATYVLERLGLRPETRVFDLVGSGCGGAIPNLQLAERFVRSNPDEIVVSVSVEICSATFEMGNDISLILSNAIFGDGAAAAVVWGRAKGMRLLHTAAHYQPKYRDDVRYVYRKGRLHNRLSPALPKIIGEIVPPIISGLLEREGLSAADVPHWAVHPGGAKMVEEIKEKLGLSEQQLATTRNILEQYGNMSSPTVLFELERILGNGIRAGEHCLMVAYGAGLSVHAYLGRIAV
ncbi:MAG: type III polyketide synthase [Chitinivibrionales bacterium]|nr:type III polyketide synthase [Chitinivibrionales bacterium]